MRNLIFVITMGVVLISCGPNQPDNKIHATDYVENGYRPAGIGNAPEKVIDTVYYIKPTWGQANAMAGQRGDRTVWVIISIVLLIAAGLMAWAWQTNRISVDGKMGGLALFVLLAGSLVAFKWQSASIKWNNKKPVAKSVYDKAIREKGSTAPIWDTLVSNYHINWGPYK